MKPLADKTHICQTSVVDIAFLKPVIEYLHVRTALDLGCGDGANALWLAEQGITVEAVDKSRIAIQNIRDQAHRRHLPTLHAIVADIRRVHYTELFDLVLCTGVLQFLSEQERQKVLRRAQEQTNPAGIHYIVIRDATATPATIQSHVDKLLHTYAKWTVLETGSCNDTDGALIAWIVAQKTTSIPRGVVTPQKRNRNQYTKT